MRNFITVLTLIFIFACNTDDDATTNPPPDEPDPVLTSIAISSSNGNQLDLNGTSTTVLGVTGEDQNNQPINISGSIQWSVDNANVSVTSSGFVTAQAVGNSTITASVENVSADFDISVIDTTPLSQTFIYVSDAGNFNNPPWQILKYDEDGSNPEVFIDEGLAWPQDIVFLESDNEVLISNLNTGIIKRYNATTGNLLGNFATGIGGPTRMKIGSDDLLYVLQWVGNGLVLRYQLDGTFVDEFTDVGITQSIGLDWDMTGNLYVSSFNDATVRKFDPDGNDLVIIIDSNLLGPTDLWFDDDGNILVNDWTGDRIAKFDADGNFIEYIVTSGIDQPEGVAFFPNGDFIIGSGGTSEVKRYDSDGNFIENLVTAGSGGLIRPNAVVIREVNN